MGNRNIRGLDGLRAIAVGLVILHHAGALLAPPRWHDVLLPGGYVGVDIFFVLSGFLITTLLLAEADTAGRIDLGRFYLRRALRLVPALVAVIIVVCTYNRLVHGEHGSSLARTVLSVGFYAVNWVKTFSADVSPGLGHTWSLAVEEQFYLLWPLLLIAGLRARLSPRSWLWLLTTAVAASAVLKAVLWSRTHDWEDVYFRTDARVDALLLGAMVAFAFHHGLPLRFARWLVPAGLLLAAAAATLPVAGLYFYGGSTVLAAAAAVVISALASGRAPGVTRALELPPVRHIGRISYGLYLWHVPAMWAVANEVHAGAGVQIPAALVLTLLLAEASMQVVERPFLRLKSRLHRVELTGEPVPARVAPARTG
jgi:peptidoglycan/LPS O-acetylase OafA/YrhL